MFEKIIDTAARIIIIWVAIDAVRQVLNPNKEEEERKEEENK